MVYENHATGIFPYSEATVAVVAGVVWGLWTVRIKRRKERKKKNTSSICDNKKSIIRSKEYEAYKSGLRIMFYVVQEAHEIK